MGFERLAWVGNVVLAAVAIILAWVPIAHDVGRWGSIAIAAVVCLAAAALFPYQRSDGLTARLADSFHFRSDVKGDNNRTQIARDNANQYMSGDRIERNNSSDE